MTEAEIQDAIRLELGDPSRYPELVLWRNNVGQLVDKRGQHVRFGVGNPGGADLLGMFRGVFVAVELKTAKGRQREAQLLFQRLVEAKGGEYVLLRSVEEARAWVERLRRKYGAME